MEEEKKICTNCKRAIPSSNFTIHVVHCTSRLTLCPKCDESVPRTELNDHLDKFHKEVTCDNCKEKIEIGLLAKHKESTCLKRLLKCQYCEIEDHADNLKEHEYYCGSRTELCGDCGQYVMLKDREVHLVSGHVGNHSNVHKQNNNYTRNSLVASDLHKDVPKPKKISNLNRELVSGFSPIKRTNDMPQINTDATGMKNKESNKPSIQEHHSNASTDLDALLAYHLAEEDAHEYYPNGFNELMEDILSHQLQEDLNVHHPANPLQTLFYNDDDADFGSPENTYFEDGLSRFTSLKRDSESTSLPCEFCGELFSTDDLIQHQSGCRPDIAHGPPQELNNTVTTNNESEEMHVFDEDNLSQIYEPALLPDVAELPCEFCGLTYPRDILIEHQNVCELNESSRETSPAKDSVPHDATQTNTHATFKPHNVSDYRQTSSRAHFRNGANDARSSDLSNMSRYTDPQRKKSTNYCHKRLPQIRNVPIKISPDYVPHSLTKRESLPNSHLSCGIPLQGNNEDSLAVKNYVKQVHKAMNPVKESIKLKTTGTRPKIQPSQGNVFRSLENVAGTPPRTVVPKVGSQPSLIRELPGFLVGVRGAEEAYKRYLSSTKNPNSPVSQHNITAQENTSQAWRTGRSGATPKHKTSKQPSVE